MNGKEKQNGFNQAYESKTIMMNVELNENAQKQLVPQRV